MDEWLRRASPAQASAEINTLDKLKLDEGDAIAFLHSDTPEGFFCAERLTALFTAKKHREVRCERLGKFGYGGAYLFTSGLKALVDVTLRLVKTAQERGQMPILCATGGFKTEIAFLNLMGALLGVEVVYLHDQHRELIRLPRLPLDWDAEFVEQNEAFFEWIDAETRHRDEVESHLKCLPKLRPLIEVGEDETAYLTAAGDLLFKTAKARLQNGPRAIWPEGSTRTPDEKNQVSKEEHRRPKGWESFVQRPCRLDCVCSVRYDDTARGSAAKVKILDGVRGDIGILFGDQEPKLSLRVETTARGEAQAVLVAKHLETWR